MTPPIRVLFVCTANICRSAFAELYAASVIGRDGLPLVVRSAGTWGLDDRAVDPPMSRQLLDAGVDPSHFRSHAVTTEDVLWADVVLTMETRHRTFLLDDYPPAVDKIFTLGSLAARVESGTPARGRALIADLASRRTGVGSGEDVVDPYGKGMEAAERTASRLTTLVDTALTGLAGTSAGSGVEDQPGQ